MNKIEKEHFDDGVKYYEEKKYEEAIQLFSEALKINDNLCEVYSRRQRAFHLIGKHDDAELDWRLENMCRNGIKITKKLVEETRGQILESRP